MTSHPSSRLLPARARRRAALLLAAGLAAAATGCSTKSSNSSPTSTGSSGGGAAGSVKTGKGISGNTITIGELTDLTGVFAALGKDVTNAQQLYWDQVNAKGGVCGKYQVKTDVKDHGYVVQNGVQLYSAIRDDVLAIGQTIGSPINTALKDKLESDQIVNIPEAWAASLTDNPYNAVVGATYQIEMINGIDYLLKQGKLHDGDKVGHIYFEGEYGEGGLAGSKYMASKHNMTVVEEKIKSTDMDMTSQVTDLKAKGVKAIFLTVAPGQTASAAGVAASQGLNVPMLGNNPVFAPGLLKTPSGPALKANLYIASPVVSIADPKAAQLSKDYAAKYPGTSQSAGVTHGYADAMVMDAFLEKACANGDLTRAGVFAAKKSLADVSTNGLTGTLNYTQVGVSPTTETYIARPADVNGGVETVTGLVTAPDVAGFKRTS